MKLKSQLEVKATPPAVSQFDDRPNNSMIRPRAAAMILGISISSLWRFIKQDTVFKIKPVLRKIFAWLILIELNHLVELFRLY